MFIFNRRVYSRTQTNNLYSAKINGRITAATAHYHPEPVRGEELRRLIRKMTVEMMRTYVQATAITTLNSAIIVFNCTAEPLFTSAML